jgi:hypothetical protein
MQRFLGLGRLPLWRGRFSLRPFILRCTDPSRCGFCSSIALSAMVLPYQLLGSLRISHSPYFFFAFVVEFHGVSIQYFLQQCPLMAFTTAPFTCWPSHQVHLRASCRHHHVRSLDQRLETPFSCRRVYWDLGLPALFKR